MKILIIGGTGTIGKEVVTHFTSGNEIIIANRSSTDYSVDIADSNSLKSLFEKAGKVDAIIFIAGEAKWEKFDELTEEDFYIGIRSKLMGQVNIVRIGKDHLTPNGSITLNTGILADDPVIKTSSAAMVNRGIHSFVQAAALELKNGIRLNVVSTGVVENAYKKYESYFPGHTPIPMNRMIRGYVRSVEGRGNGQVIRIYD
ncbi:MAG: NAD(P)-dependent dehydrogenase (short-subunit alcohol dehydrogenase family) [Saprospiraceae bacterium]|jgi:NAD(P)-dependent dehydrogenase (short-subunit alcohol dehydrogenase family)